MSSLNHHHVWSYDDWLNNNPFDDSFFFFVLKSRNDIRDERFDGKGFGQIIHAKF